MAEKEYIELGKVIDLLEWDNDIEKWVMSYGGFLMLLPSDVVEVVHAIWIDHKNGNATCSHCRIRQKAVYDDENEQHFCGHCGARMDGGKDDGNL